MYGSETRGEMEGERGRDRERETGTQGYRETEQALNCGLQMLVTFRPSKPVSIDTFPQQSHAF